MIDLHRGRLRVRGWPRGLRVPSGLGGCDGVLVGPPRLRGAVLRALRDAGVACVDTVAPPPLADAALPPSERTAPAALAAWCAHGERGVAVGLPEPERHALLVAAVRAARAAALVVVRDSAAAAAWAAALQQLGAAGVATVWTAQRAARAVYGGTAHGDLLAVDRPEQTGAPDLAAGFDANAARCRIAFVDHGPHRTAMDAFATYGPVLTIATPTARALRIEIRIPLRPDARVEHDRAWDAFLCAYDRFAAARSGAGFGTFVAQARLDPVWREALLAWHRAVRIAAWNDGKAAAVDALLERHRGARILVFTPDRASAYAMSRAHLVPAVTGELRRAERDARLADFRAGRVRVLVGPRLLELGVPEGFADVGILVGGGHGRARHDACVGRVGRGGVVYELVSEDTMEVGRARRSDRSDAAAALADRDGGT